MPRDLDEVADIPIGEVKGHSRPTLNAAIACGHLKSYLAGRRRFIRPVDLRAWLDFLKAESDAGRPVSYRSREIEALPREQRSAALNARHNMPGAKEHTRQTKKERIRDASTSR